MDCDTPYKQGFESIDDARRYLAHDAARYRHISGSRPTRVYECRCGHWHVTGPKKKPTRRGSRKRDKKNSHRRSGKRHDRQLPPG